MEKNTEMEEKQKYTSAEHLLTLKGPKAIEKDWTDEKSGIVVHIKGISSFFDRLDVFAKANELTALAPPQSIDGVVVKPNPKEMECAYWAEQCVTEPKLSFSGWLKVARENGDFAFRLYREIFICNREIEENSAAKEAKETLEQNPL
jgi:hypothetical protein